jgi:hypothetical protein
MSQNQENNCYFVSSRGILKSCDIYSFTPVSSIRQMINYNMDVLTKESTKIQTIYVCSEAIKYFLSVLPSIPYNFVLVTGDCDSDCYKDILSEHEFQEFINNEKLVHWYSQNCVSNHPKLTRIPIGLDYHTIASNKNHSWGENMTPVEQEKELQQCILSAEPLNKRLVKGYSNFHFLMNTRYGNDRVDATHKIPAELVFYEPNKITRLESWKTQIQYAFVISPHGGGYDCHRTWEALCLGCIPIVKTSPIDSLFDELPVLIVREWSDVTQELLNKTIVEFSKKSFNYNKLTLEYWVSIFCGDPLL